MYRLPVWKQHNAQIPTAHLLDRRPTANATVLLEYLFHWMLNDALDPLRPNRTTIRTLTHSFEIPRELHPSTFHRCE